MADFECKNETFRTMQGGDVLVVAFSGMINTATFPEFQARVGKAVTKDTPRVVSTWPDYRTSTPAVWAN